MITYTALTLYMLGCNLVFELLYQIRESRDLCWVFKCLLCFLLLSLDATIELFQ